MLQESNNKRTICRYSSGTFKIKIVNTLDADIRAITEAIDKFKMFLDKEFTIDTDSENIVKHVNKSTCKTSFTKLGHRRWLNFVNQITGNGYNQFLNTLKVVIIF